MIMKKLAVLAAVILGVTSFHPKFAEAGHEVGHDTQARASLLEMQDRIVFLEEQMNSLLAANTGLIAQLQAAIATNSGDIATNAAAISSNDGDIAANVGAIAANGTNIATNVGNIASNAADIADLSSALTVVDGTVGTLGTDVTALQGTVGTLGTDVTGLKTDVTNLKTSVGALESILIPLNNSVGPLPDKVAALEAAQEDLTPLTNYINDLATYINVDRNPTVTGTSSGSDVVEVLPTIHIEGANLQVTNGIAPEYCLSGNCPNGLGNLIVGYNTPRKLGSLMCSDASATTESACHALGAIWSRDFQNGSHNLVAGNGNSYGGMSNAILGSFNVANSNNNELLGDYMVSGVYGDQKNSDDGGTRLGNPRLVDGPQVFDDPSTFTIYTDCLDENLQVVSRADHKGYLDDPFNEGDNFLATYRLMRCFDTNLPPLP
jgi:hypothetical protein